MKSNFKSNFIGVLMISLAAVAGLVACSEKENYDSLAPDAANINSVTTLAPAHVTTTSAELKGSVTLEGAAEILERGIYLTDSYNPLMPQPGNGNEFLGRKYVGQIINGDAFTVSLTGLKANTRYKYIAFATTVTGTSFGEMKSLVTSYGTVTDVEVNEYQTVMIGNQVWMRENLKSELYADEEYINGKYDTETDHLLGKHYTWSAANRLFNGAKSEVTQGVCPTGWHLPSDDEWKVLLKYVGVPGDQVNSLGLIGDDQATKLKDGDINHWSNPMIDNTTGFSVLPAGISNPDMGDDCIQTAFWTSTPYVYYGFQADSEKIFRGNAEPDCECGISVRCIKD